MLRLGRPPRTDVELWWVIKSLWGIKLPNVRVCPEHVSPFEAVAHAYFAREPGYAVWYASRGSGKSLALAVLGLTKTFILDVDTTILGGSMTQSQNVREHMSKLLEFKRAPIYAMRKNTATAITTTTGKLLRPLPASQTTVRGPHPPLSLLDECFAGSTLIDTPTGSIRIDSLVPGDTVRAWNGAETVDRQVLAARQTGVRATLRVEFSTGQELLVTGNHPILTPAGWVRADALQAGQIVCGMSQTTDRTRRRDEEEEPIRSVSGVLASQSSSGENSAFLQGLRQSVLGDRGARVGKMSQLCTEGAGSSQDELCRLREADDAEVSAVSTVLAQTPVFDRHDTTDGTGTCHGTEDQGAGESGRTSDGGAARQLRCAVRTLSAVRSMDSGLRVARRHGRHRGARSLLARPGVSDRSRRAKESCARERRLDSAVRANRPYALLVAVSSVSPGPTVPVFNLTVEGEHTYVANGIVVHNCDEMDYAIFQAALGQAMEQINTRGEIVGEYIVASSTWQNPEGTFTKIIDDARDKGLPIFTWCWRELLKTPENPNGWMSQAFIDRKRRNVSHQMWITEYELNEPSGTDRAVDLDKVEQYFITYPEPLKHIAHGENNEEWTWEEWEPSGDYYVGADWAKSVDKTVIAVIRADGPVRRLVYLRRVNKHPYPVMIAWFDEVCARYNAQGMHDITGLGSVVHDFSEAASADGSQVKGFDFRAAKKRTEMLLDYIVDFENGAYLLPRAIPSQEPGTNKGLTPFYRAHRNVTNADVYAPSKWDAHLPDDFAAMALAHRAAGRTVVVGAQGVPQNNEPRKVDAPFHAQPDIAPQYAEVGGVTIVDDRYEDTGTFWLSPED